MKLALVTDAWRPQVNGVVTTLVAGPLDVVGGSPGGVLDDDLQRAAQRAFQVPREAARVRAQAFGWDAVCEQFLAHLVRLAPVQAHDRVGLADERLRHENVTRLS